MAQPQPNATMSHSEERMPDVILELRDIHVSVGETEIIRGIDLTIERGTIHALMGPNGSGKSTLSLALMGHPKYKITRGDARFEGRSILDLTPTQRSLAGLFLCFQYPSAVPGVSVANFLRNTLMARHKGAAPLTPARFKSLLDEGVKKLKMDPAVLGRYVNEASPEVRKSASRCCKCSCSSRRSQFWTRPTPVSTSTRCASS